MFLSAEKLSMYNYILWCFISIIYKHYTYIIVYPSYFLRFRCLRLLLLQLTLIIMFIQKCSILTQKDADVLRYPFLLWQFAKNNIYSYIKISKPHKLIERHGHQHKWHKSLFTISHSESSYWKALTFDLLPPTVH